MTNPPAGRPVLASDLAVCRYDQVCLPALHISGWYDIFLSAAFDNYQGMRQRGGSERARAETNA